MLDIIKPTYLDGALPADASAMYVIPSILKSTDRSFIEHYCIEHHLSYAAIHCQIHVSSDRLRKDFILGVDSDGKLNSVRMLNSHRFMPVSLRHAQVIDIPFESLEPCVLFASWLWLILLRVPVHPTLVVIVGQILLSIVLTILLSPRYGWKPRATILWSLGSLLLGLYTPFLILALGPMPAQEPCTHCKKKRVVTNLYCKHCGTIWPSPAHTTMEIFEPNAKFDVDSERVGR